MDSAAGNIAIWAVTITSIAALVGIVVAVIGGVKGILSVGKWIQKRESFEETTQKAIAQIEEAIKEIRKELSRIAGHMGKPAIQGQSPLTLTLTDMGHSISEEIDAKAWAKENAQKFADQVMGRPPYAIQEFSFDLVRGEKYEPTTDLLEKMKASAYNHGTTIEQVENVLAVKLCDALLKIHGLDPPE